MVTLTVYVQPNAKQTEIHGYYGGHLKIKLAATPVEGQANKALVTFLAERLDVARTRIQLVRGEKSRLKTVELSIELTPEEILKRLTQ